MIGRIVFPSPIFPNTLLDENMFWRVLSGVAGGCVELYVWNWTSLYTSIPAHTAHCAQAQWAGGENGRVNKSPEQWLLCDRQVRIIQCHLHVAFEFLELLSFELMDCIICLSVFYKFNAMLFLLFQSKDWSFCLLLNLSFIDYQTKFSWLAIG